VLDGQALIAQDQFAAGLEQLDRAFSEFKAQEAGVGLPWAMSIAVEAHARLGRSQDALETLSKAFEAIAGNGERHWEAELFRLKGEVLHSAPSADGVDAEACFRRAILLAREQSARSLELRATMSLARLLEREGKLELAHSLVHDASGWFTEGFDTTDIRDARIALER
jgi:predicted ATPase